MWNSPCPPACIGQISGLISLSNPSDVFRSYQHRYAQQHGRLDKRRQNLSHNQKAVGVQLPSERRPKNKTQAFHGLHTFLMSMVMDKAVKEAQFKVRSNNPAYWPHPWRADDWISRRSTPGYIAVYPNKWHLDKGRQAIDVVNISSRETPEIEWVLPRPHCDTPSDSLNSWGVKFTSYLTTVSLTLTCAFLLCSCSAIILATGTSKEDIVFVGLTVQDLKLRLGDPLRVHDIEPPILSINLENLEKNFINLLAHDRVTRNEIGQVQYLRPSDQAVKKHYYRFTGRLKKQHDVGSAISITLMSLGIGELLLTPIAVREREIARDHSLIVWFDEMNKGIAYRWISSTELPW